MRAVPYRLRVPRRCAAIITDPLLAHWDVQQRLGVRAVRLCAGLLFGDGLWPVVDYVLVHAVSGGLELRRSCGAADRLSSRRVCIRWWICSMCELCDRV